MLALIILVLLMCLVVPLLALSRAFKAERQTEDLATRLDQLERELRQLRSGPQQSKPAAPADAESREEDPAIARLRQAAAKTGVRKQPVPRQQEVQTPVPPPLQPQPSVSASTETETQFHQPAMVRPVSKAGEAASHPPVITPAGSSRKFNWEQFMGVRLFAWLGGLALFLAAAFFVKFSFDHGWISPVMRVSLGYLLGLGLVVGGVLMSRKKYKITADTLCATGVVILYAVTFACRSVYEFALFSPVVTFVLMSCVTAGAFYLAVRMRALVVAVLGMLGGFLTPILISTGQDQPFALFSYIALLDVGLLAIASVRRWNWLAVAAAIGTVLMQLLWSVEFFAVEKVYVAMAIYLVFGALFFLGDLFRCRRDGSNRWSLAAALVPPAMTLCFTLFVMSHPDLGLRPGIVYSFLAGADLVIVALAFLRLPMRWLGQVGGGAVFLLLAFWTTYRVNESILMWVLNGYLVFAILHCAIPIIQQRRHPETPVSPLAHLFPLISLVLILVPMLKLEVPSILIWSFVILFNLLAIGVAIVAASVAGMLAAVVLTAGVALFWLFRMPAEAASLPEMLLVLGGMAAAFTVAGVLGGRKIVERQKRMGNSGDRWLLPSGWVSEDLQRQVPALSAILPFLLLTLVAGRIPLSDPSPFFLLALLLGALLLGLTRWLRMDWLPAIGLGCTVLLQFTWQFTHLQNSSTGMVLLWYAVFHAMYLAFPFVFIREHEKHSVTWVAAALSGPVHFFQTYRLIDSGWQWEGMGLVPALFAVPSLLGLAGVLKIIPAHSSNRKSLLAWFGGVSLFFITLIFPIQFERQWLTIAWAFEGAALLWLFHRVPHHGLRYTGAALLTVSFVRLAFNESVLGYFPRSETPIFNWYLYTYGLVAAALFAGARLLSPPHEKLLNKDARPWLVAMGTILAFLLLNIEIADFFSDPEQGRLRFSFHGNFARDMTYTIAWAGFALVLLVAGILRRLKAARYAGIALLGVTLLKLFLHDLAALHALYRVGALVGVAVIAIVASFLYQKFLAAETGQNHSGTTDNEGHGSVSK